MSWTTSLLSPLCLCLFAFNIKQKLKFFNFLRQKSCSPWNEAYHWQITSTLSWDCVGGGGNTTALFIRSKLLSDYHLILTVRQLRRSKDWLSDCHLHLQICYCQERNDLLSFTCVIRHTTNGIKCCKYQIFRNNKCLKKKTGDCWGWAIIKRKTGK